MRDWKAGLWASYWSPLLPGLEVSLSQPVYWMVTTWPLAGEEPLPSEMTVLVTPMMTVGVVCVVGGKWSNSCRGGVF